MAPPILHPHGNIDKIFFKYANMQINNQLMSNDQPNKTLWCTIENHKYLYNLPKRRYKVWHFTLEHPVDRYTVMQSGIRTYESPDSAMHVCTSHDITWKNHGSLK